MYTHLFGTEHCSKEWKGCSSVTGIKYLPVCSSWFFLPLVEVEALYAHYLEMFCFFPGTIHISSPVLTVWCLSSSSLSEGVLRWYTDNDGPCTPANWHPPSPGRAFPSLMLFQDSSIHKSGGTCWLLAITLTTHDVLWGRMSCVPAQHHVKMVMITDAFDPTEWWQDVPPRHQ